MDCIGQYWQKLFANKIKTIEGIYKFYFLVAFQNPYADLGAGRIGLEPITFGFGDHCSAIEPPPCNGAQGIEPRLMPASAENQHSMPIVCLQGQCS